MNRHNRRSILGMLCSIALSPFLVKPKTQEPKKPEHYSPVEFFTWVDNYKPWTTSSKFNCLEYGGPPKNMIFLDGVDISSYAIHRMITGQYGWVEVTIGEDGWPLEYHNNVSRKKPKIKNGLPETKRLYGRVDYVRGPCHSSKQPRDKYGRFVSRVYVIRS